MRITKFFSKKECAKMCLAVEWDKDEHCWIAFIRCTSIYRPKIDALDLTCLDYRTHGNTPDIALHCLCEAIKGKCLRNGDYQIDIPEHLRL